MTLTPFTPLSYKEWADVSAAYDHAWSSLMKNLFSPQYRLITIVLNVACLASYFSYYGMVYGLPETFRQQEEQLHTTTPAGSLLASALFEIPGIGMAILLGWLVAVKWT